jgi:3-methyladenine DNA glycosylase AlkD
MATHKRSADDRPIETQVQSALGWLREHATDSTLKGMARFAIPAGNALGVSVGDIRKLGKSLGRNHELAAALWSTKVYEARLLACFVDEPKRVTPEQMEQWALEFDSWAICDTACFALFASTPAAWEMVERWHHRREEFVRRAAFAMIASLVLHDKRGTDQAFVRGLELIESGAADSRNFVKKSVNWALRTVGKRNRALNAAAIVVAERLAASTDAAERWVGKSAVKELTGAAVARRLAGKDDQISAKR